MSETDLKDNRGARLPRVLVLEDHADTLETVTLLLRRSGHEVFPTACCAEARTAADSHAIEAVVGDLGLPDGDGVTLVRDVRGWSSVPIIVLSARIDEADKVAALDAGADDYLVKPFGVAELLARVRASLRRRAQGAGESPIVHFGAVSVDLTNRRVTQDGADVHLTQIEFRLLATLLAHPGKVLTHRQLLRDVWGPSHVEHNHYLRIYMGHLRQKLEADPAQPRYLLTETGVGYRFAGG